MTFEVYTAETVDAFGAQRYPFAFLTFEPVMICASTRTGIIEGIIDGYEQLTADAEDNDPWLTLRFLTLARIAGNIQAVILADATEKHPELVASLSEDEMTVLLHPRDEAAPVFEEWPIAEIPLILMETSYAPYTEFPRPKGANILWVNPHTEGQFIESLEALGFGELFLNEEALME